MVLSASNLSHQVTSICNISCLVFEIVLSRTYLIEYDRHPGAVFEVKVVSIHKIA